MTEPAPPPPGPPSPRIGTAERDAAMAALDAHLEAGRLDVEEYGERSARAAEARTAADLEPLFTDLPDPRPPFGAAPAPAVPATPGTTERDPVARREPGALARYGPAISGALPIIALVLFLTVPIPNAWVFFLVIPLGGWLFASSRRGGS
ncbi:DUF1707 SHOCT-like domain-containing protein [Actinomycetospora straminea]|uniref:DUF1707 domain-containing protein n=1 Tax=Actinomycetospora straminea TaxID=663607 RepID=A0ABP9F798_9PSEU|nr:DUF1707 domain-containing protein [Actinomycetospora straminea]MDD7935790.1 DUF1707 domain-containing protein [Actinomycetospora straminea]